MPVVTLADEIANIDQRGGWVMFWMLAVLAVLIGGGMLAAAWRPPAPPAGDLGPYELAVLARGNRAAVLSAAVFLHTGGVPDHPLVNAVRVATAKRPGLSLERLESVGAVDLAVRDIRSSLKDRRFLGRSWVRAGYSVAAVLAANALYLGVALPYGPPHPWYLTIFVSSVVLAGFGFQSPTTTSRLRPARRALDGARGRTAPASTGWPAGGPEAAATLVALDGIPAVWTADPAFATALALPPEVPGLDRATIQRGCGDDLADREQVPD